MSGINEMTLNLRIPCISLLKPCLKAEAASLRHREISGTDRKEQMFSRHKALNKYLQSMLSCKMVAIDNL